ncbi:hypothetical protein DVH24_013580 [Malus domestica]|uniref:Helicase ATP-binding domain-containing protein n=1 Tax=Malus domestica TaxID=3750 RepID=A0A498JG38_MALDO|nr:hypothetical protein DVH24_013580 [Malus domestica]
MNRAPHMRQDRPNLGQDFCAQTPVKANLLEHVNALDNFSCPHSVLSSNFIFSLPTRKPLAEEAMVFGYVADVSAEYRPDVGRTALPSSCNIDKSRVHMQTHQYINGTNTRNSEAGTCLGNPLPSSNFNVADAGKNLGRQSQVRASMVNSSDARVLDGSLSNNSVHTSQGKDSAEVFVNDLDDDDDDILENIDVDQIVEQYQSSCTPQPSSFKLPPITPFIDKDNRQEATSLPPELCSNCSHGFKIGLCPEAGSHLQEMKDTLIIISNQLLDDVNDLSPEQINKLRQDRKTKVTFFCIKSNSLDEFIQFLKKKKKKKKATPRPFQCETPQQAAFRTDPMRFDSQVHPHNESGGYERCNSSSVSFSSVDRLGFSSCPVEKEPCISKFVEVNYIEGSKDKKWSSDNFPWTNKLEDGNKKVFGNHSFRLNQREVINATMSGYDVFVLMPTGGGKSLTYQLPALICQGITLVISPLVSLIQDQIMHLLQANIPAAYLSANMEWTEQQEILRELNYEYCKYKLLYVTPEKVAKEGTVISTPKISFYTPCKCIFLSNYGKFGVPNEIFGCSRPNLGQDFCAQTPVKANLLEHVNPLDNFSCPHNVLSSNFIFSLPTQNPHAKKAMGSWYVAMEAIIFLIHIQILKNFPSMNSFYTNQVGTYIHMMSSFRTAKYSVLTFLPRNLFEQFHRVAYIYFLVIAVLNQLTQLAVLAVEFPYCHWHLCFLLLLLRMPTRTIGGIDLIELRTIVWHQFWLVTSSSRKSEAIPCDMVLLSTSDPTRVAYVLTINLDGESNLKTRYAKQETLSKLPDKEKITGLIKCENPNRNIYGFHAFMEIDGKRLSLGPSNIVLRGCELKNTHWALGVAVYAGRETKVMLNSSGAPSKRNRLETCMNFEIILLSVFLVTLCTVVSLCAAVWLSRNNDKLDDILFYRKKDNLDEKLDDHNYYGWGLEILFTFLMSVIVFQVKIPISLYVCMELVRVGQAYFMIRDGQMYDEASNSRFQCRALNINEDLGQIKYAFSFLRQNWYADRK